MRYVKCALAALALLAVPSCGRRVPPVPTAGVFGANPIWEGGKREVSTYVGTTEVGAGGRPATARLVVMRSDHRWGGDVHRGRLDMNLFTYGPVLAAGDSAITAVVFSLDLRVVRLAAGQYRVDNAEGQPFRVSRVALVGGRLRHLSATEVRWPSTRLRVYYDALPVWLRQWGGEKPPFEMRVWLFPSLLTEPSGKNARPMDASIRMMDGGTLVVPAGRFAALEFAVSWGGKADVYWFDAKYPHVLLKVQTATHRTLELTSTVREE